MTQQPICLFDSGIGGLTVLKKLINKFPNENYIYFADLARVPFGDKTKEEIKEIASEIIEWLSRFNPKTIIMACNTSSSVLCEQGRINPAPTVPIYGMIKSCAKEIANSNYLKISVWATSLVVENKAYKNSINNLNQKIEVSEIACPKLVPMIESLNTNHKEQSETLQKYINQIPNDSQALILGCTHYPLINEVLQKLIKIKIIDPTDALIKELEKHLIPCTGNKQQISIYATAGEEKLQRFAKLFLCEDVKVNLVKLHKLSSYKALNKIF
ncbi:MAG: glutamate racemase [Candidatus Melainabacteria bacterium]|nr:glutamate racemase [Candidatus Melainabacteria bacterium]